MFNIDNMEAEEEPIPKSLYTLEREKLENNLKSISAQISEMKRNEGLEEVTGAFYEEPAVEHA